MLPTADPPPAPPCEGGEQILSSVEHFTPLTYREGPGEVLQLLPPIHRGQVAALNS